MLAGTRTCLHTNCHVRAHASKRGCPPKVCASKLVLVLIKAARHESKPTAPGSGFTAPLPKQPRTTLTQWVYSFLQLRCQLHEFMLLNEASCGSNWL
jgi:hypothetical protein